IHAQVVVCPGINDGKHLEKTILDLAQFHRGRIPTVASVAVVPVGLTRFRPNQDELIPVTPEKAQEIITQVQNLQQKFQQELGSTCVWIADELFLIAGAELPPESHYQDYPQIGNGVGSIRKFIKEFEQTVKDYPIQSCSTPRQFTWVVGNAVEKAFQPLVKSLNEISGLTVNLVALASQYWGQEITVTGLLTGQDLRQKLTGKILGDGILLPSVMLKQGEAIFLDDMTVAELAEQLQIPIFPVSNVQELLSTAMGD
ncbi:DUF512 domain-containing protein, partial [Planktothrix agardhii]